MKNPKVSKITLYNEKNNVLVTLIFIVFKLHLCKEIHHISDIIVTTNQFWWCLEVEMLKILTKKKQFNNYNVNDKYKSQMKWSFINGLITHSLIIHPILSIDSVIITAIKRINSEKYQFRDKCNPYFGSNIISSNIHNEFQH